MIFKFGQTSMERLATCHADLRRIAHTALAWQVMDLVVICGFRGRSAQNRAFKELKSTKQWPDSLHNHLDVLGRPESLALDIGPWVDGRIPWDKPKYFYLCSGLVLAAAAHENIAVRWGGDWDSDRDLDDQRFDDLVHFELVRTSDKAVTA